MGVFRKKVLQTCGAAAFGLALWQLVAAIVYVRRGVLFPTPVECFTGLVHMLGGAEFLDHSIYRHTLESCLRWIQGFGVAFCAGLVYAFAAVCLPFFRAVSMPTVEVFQLIPGLAWVPVVILLFGLNPTATIAIIALTTFPIMAVAGVMGFGSVDARYLQAGRMCGYGPWGLFRTVYVPGALPHLLSGTRIAVGSSWRVLVAAEMVVGSGSGLGYAIIQSRWTMDYVSAFVCIIIISVLGLALERLVLLPLERRTLRRWGMNNAP